MAVSTRGFRVSKLKSLVVEIQETAALTITVDRIEGREVVLHVQADDKWMNWSNEIPKRKQKSRRLE